MTITRPTPSTSSTHRSPQEGLCHPHPTRTERRLRKRLMACAVLLGLVSVLPACSAAKPDVTVTLHRHERYAHMMHITVQSVADSTVIKDMKVNRGNCPLVENTVNALNRTVPLKFGENWTGYPKSCTFDNVKEVEVTTSNGTFSFGF